MAVVALMTGQWLILPVVAIIPVSEVVSDILQVGYFKLTKGKRLFKMAPLHHHFELMGWSETQVVQRFWLISLIAAILGMALFGVLFSLYLTYLEPFVIGAVCAWCLTSAVIITLLMLLSLRPVLQAVEVREEL